MNGNEVLVLSIVCGVLTAGLLFASVWYVIRVAALLRMVDEGQDKIVSITRNANVRVYDAEQAAKKKIVAHREMSRDAMRMLRGERDEARSMCELGVKAGIEAGLFEVEESTLPWISRDDFCRKHSLPMPHVKYIAPEDDDG